MYYFRTNNRHDVFHDAPDRNTVDFFAKKETLISFNANGCDVFHNAQDVKKSELYFFDANDEHDVFHGEQDRNAVTSVLTTSDENQLGNSNLTTFELDSFHY